MSKQQHETTTTALSKQVQSLLFKKADQFKDDIVWCPVSLEEKRDMLETTGQWDLDFLCIRGGLGNILNDPDVARMLGGSSGIIYSKVFTQPMRCCNSRKMLIFCKIGDYFLGQSLPPA